MPQVIEAGKVYAAVPPLYGIKEGKRMKYFTDKQDLVKYTQGIFNKRYQLTYMNNTPISSKEMTKLFYTNIDYAHDLQVASDILAVDINLLELVLFEVARIIEFNVENHIAMAFAARRLDAMVNTNPTKTLGEEDDVSASDPNNVKTLIDSSVSQAISYSIDNLDFKKFRSYMEKKYRFIKVFSKNGVINIQGLVNSKYQYLFLNEHTITICINLIRQIANNENWWFKVNGEVTSLYGVMKLVNNATPNNLDRYKGLGEQDYMELRESTMDPASRTIIRYTLESAKEEIENIRYIDSNRSALFNGIVVGRQDVE